MREIRPIHVRCVLGGFVCLCLLAQEPTIRTNVPLVLVPVTVTDSKGKTLDGLEAADFALKDDDVPQKQIRLDTSDTVLAPVALVVAIQASGISQPAIEKIRKIGSLIQPLVGGERSEAAVLAYDAEVRTLQDFTRNGDKISGAFATVQPRTFKNGVMIDAVMQSVQMLSTRPENYRRILITLGESRDRGSKSKLDKAGEAAQRAGVVIYPITYSAQKTAWTAKNPTTPEDPNLIGVFVELGRMGTANQADYFARQTGGQHLSFARLQGLEDALGRLATEIHSQYLLSFVPEESKNKGYHRLNVEVRGHPGAVVRARPGYWP